MRSFHRNRCLLAAFALLGAACGGDGDGGGPDNNDPVAAFTFNCNALACTFTDGSSDADGADDLASWSWDFGGDGTADVQNPTHTFSAAGTYAVELTVTDDASATDVATVNVTVTTTANVNPTADFHFICNAEVCTFTDDSDDDDGTIASRSWDFGDGSAASTQTNPVHTYQNVTELTDFDVTLTVTDDDGGTGTVTKTAAVAPPAQTTCDDGLGNQVECGLVLTNAASVRVTITGRDCTADGNTLIITEPDDPDTVVFDDGCALDIGDFFDLNGGTPYAAGTELRAQMISGSDDPGRIAPALQVTGTYPDWTLSFDDGEDPTGPGEPDFNDIIMTVHATE